MSFSNSKTFTSIVTSIDYYEGCSKVEFYGIDTKSLYTKLIDAFEKNLIKVYASWFKPGVKNVDMLNNGFHILNINYDEVNDQILIKYLINNKRNILLNDVRQDKETPVVFYIYNIKGKYIHVTCMPNRN